MAGLLLIRHAETAVNPNSPSYIWKLTVNGRLQAKQFATRLSILPTILYTSVEEKAKETGSVITGTLGIISQVISDIHENDRTGVLFLPNRAVFKASIVDFFKKPDQLIFGRETTTEAFTRFSRAVTALYQEGVTDVVTHDTIITLFICHHNPTLNPIDF